MLQILTNTPSIYDENAAMGVLVMQVIGLPLGVFLILYFVSTRFPKQVSTLKRRMSKAAITIAVAIVIAGVTIAIVSFLNNEKSYYSSVSAWLESDYGISVSDADAHALVGDLSVGATPLVADVNGVPQTIVILKTSDQHLAVANADLSLLTPIG
jgi:hypothetical protein